MVVVYVVIAVALVVLVGVALDALLGSRLFARTRLGGARAGSRSAREATLNGVG